MTHTQWAAVAAASALALSGAVHAQPAAPRPATLESPPAAAELTGPIVKAERKTVWVNHLGAIVALAVEGTTQVAGPNISRAQDLRPGQTIQVSFVVQGVQNLARSIRVQDAGALPPQSGGGRHHLGDTAPNPRGTTVPDTSSPAAPATPAPGRDPLRPAGPGQPLDHTAPLPPAPVPPATRGVP